MNDVNSKILKQPDIDIEEVISQVQAGDKEAYAHISGLKIRPK